MSRLLTVILTIWLAGTAGAHDRGAFVNVTREQGLAGESVNKIIIDHRGIVWLATSNGVNIFDGVHPVTIPIDDGGADDRFVYDICEDERQTIFITMATGLYELRKGDTAFRRIAPLTNKTSLTTAGGRLYAVNRDALQVYDGRELRTVDLGADPKTLLPRSLAADDAGRLWLLTDSKLLLLADGREPATPGYVTHYVKKSYDLEGMCRSGIPLAQVAVCGGQLLIATKGSGLYRFDPATGQTTRIEGIGNVVSHISDAGDGRLCVATDGAGASLLNVETGETERHLGTGETDGDLPTDAVYCYLHDRQGNDWVGLSRYGMAYTSHVTSLTHTYTFGDFTTKGMNVRSFCAYEQDRLIGTYQGLYYVDETQGTVRHYGPQQLGGGHIVTDIARYGNDYYIATYDGGLWKIRPGSNQPMRASDNSQLAGANINVLRVSTDGRLWVGASTGVYVLDSLGHTEAYTNNSMKMNNVNVSAIVFDSRGNTWVCGNQGIAMFDRESRLFVDGAFPEGFFNHVGYLKGCLAGDGRMYFGNKAVYYTDQQMKAFGRLDISEKLMAESLGDLLADRQGGLWMATEKGLFRRIEETDADERKAKLGSFAHYHLGYSEGVSSQMIGRGSLRLSDRGNLWFATAEGLQWIALADVNRWVREEQARIVLYDIIRGGHQIKRIMNFT